MNTTYLSQNWSRGSAWARGISLLALAAGVWGLSTAASEAHAGDVYWSVGVHSPGVVVGVSNAPPVIVRPRPIVVYEEPVFYERRPYVVEHVVERVVVREPVYLRGYGPNKHKHKHKWKKRDRRDWDD